MKTRTLNPLIALLVLAIGAPSRLQAQGEAFTYQGRLQDGTNLANGTYDLTFTVFNTNTGPGAVAGPITNFAVALSNGLFTVALEVGAGVFTGPGRWLEIGVRTNSGPPGFTALSPRQKITASPYALLAGNISGVVSNSSLAGSYSSILNFHNIGNAFVGGFTGNGSGLTNVNASTLGGLAASNFWPLSTPFSVPGYAKSSLPSPGITGRLARVIENSGNPETGQAGLKIADGTNFVHVSAKPGVVVVYPPVNDPYGQKRMGVVLAPDGTFVDTTASLTCGLQEAINYASENRYDLEVIGGDDPGGNSITYFCSVTLNFPPMQGKHVRFGAVGLGWSLSSIGSDPGLVFDSCMMCNFEFSGEIRYGGSGPALVFKPRTLLPLDPARIIIDSRFKFVTVGGNGTAAVEFDTRQTGNVGITASRFEFVEINAAQYSILVRDPIGGSRFAGNRILVNHAHGAANTGIKVGEGAAVGPIENNIWDVVISTEAGNRRGIVTHGSKDIWFASIEGPTTAFGLTVEAAASKNQFFFMAFEGAGFQNSASEQSNKLYLQRVKTQAAIPVGTSPFGYQNRDMVEETVTIQAGTVSQIAYSLDNVTFYDCGVTAGAFPLAPGMYIRVTYSVTAPIMRKFF